MPAEDDEIYPECLMVTDYILNRTTSMETIRSTYSNEDVNPMGWYSRDSFCSDDSVFKCRPVNIQMAIAEARPSSSQFNRPELYVRLDRALNAAADVSRLTTENEKLKARIAYLEAEIQALHQAMELD